MSSRDGGALEEIGDATVLLVEDTAALARTYLGYLRDESFRTIHVDTGKAGLARMEEGGVDLVLLDLRLPDVSGEEVMAAMRKRGLSIPVIVITAQGSVGVAVEAMRAGAVDFLVKPFSEDRLTVSIRSHLDQSRFLRREAEAEARAKVTTGAEKCGASAPAPVANTETEDGFSGFIGASTPMRAVYRLIRGAARSSATVFITGESGTGKEVCAQAIHDNSARTKAEFVAINCAAIPGELMESEIFGHVRGAFTGATGDKIGAAKLADGGTLFLDEICEMSPHLQTKLLRFIQTGAFNPVGKPASEKVNVRFICATNRDPLEEVAAGRFREDLYYRLHVIPITLPPLRDRGEDVMRIAQMLIGQFAEEESKRFDDFSEDAREALLAYSWPGNVRQLQNVLRNAVVLGEGPLIDASMLRAPVGAAPGAKARSEADGLRKPPPPATATPPAPDPNDLNALASAIRPLDAVERETIENAVSICGGDVRKAAVFLGVSPATIYRKRKIWETAARDAP